MEINYIKRENCAITNGQLEPLFSVDFPLFCGCSTDKAQDDIICKQSFAISQSGVLQLENLIPLEILYKDGHDSGLVGALWEEHHKEFATFITDNLTQTKNHKVLEIGGGHGKLSQHCLKTQPFHWTIIEPNTKIKHKNVNYIDGFFTKDTEPSDIIVHSHTFEHIYNPNKFLQNIANNLKMGGGGAI